MNMNPIKITTTLWCLLILCSQFAFAYQENSPTESESAPPIAAPGDHIANPYEGHLIREVRVEGLNRVSEQMVRNQLRTEVGQPYQQEIIDKYDVPNLTRLNTFRRIQVQAELTDDGGVIVTFRVNEWSLIADVQVTGNHEVSDQEIQKTVHLRANDPVDSYQINIAKESIQELYRKKGFYLATVDIDNKELASSRIVLFKVREGPRVRIRTIEFRGNQSFRSKVLHSILKTKTWILFLRSGELDEDSIKADIQRLIDYYRDRGYLDVRVDRQINLSNDRKEAKLILRIEEGPLYTMRAVRTEGDSRLTDEQAAALMIIKSGDVYSQDKIRKSVKAIEDYFGRLGYYGTTVTPDQVRHPGQAVVDLILHIREQPLAYTGEVRVVGNEITKRKVIMRELEVRPDRPLNQVGLDNSVRRLKALNLFELSTQPIAVQAPDPLDKRYRDVLVEVKEKNTAKLGFGAAVSSDLGLFGSIDFEQRNFDITDTPESFSELMAGRAFRGAGQTFRIVAQPGSTFSNFSIALTEPYIFGTNNSFSSSLALTTQQLESWDESRAGGRFSAGRRLGEFWVLNGSARIQSVSLTNISKDAPTEVFKVEDQNIISGLGFGLRRRTYDNPVHPSRGSKIDLQLEQVGLLGGDFNFTRLNVEHSVYFTLDEDFLGRKSILSMTTRAGYLFGGTTPIYERLFLGGRSFRGFDYRTISPKGIRNDNKKISQDPIGGDWLFFWGLQYERPIYGKNISGVIFLDTGTVDNTPGFSNYRASVGFGLRLLIPQFGQAPMAFDIAIPINKSKGDRTRVFSFSIDVPL